MGRARCGTTAVYIDVYREESALLKRLARRDGITVAQLIRDCINDRLAEEEDPNVSLIRMRPLGRPKADVQKALQGVPEPTE